MSNATDARVLSAPLKVAFDYTRSTGPVLGRFMTGMRDRQVVGARLSDGRVAVPPVEYDPVTHEQITDFVEVADTGTVVTWSWVSEPVAEQPFDRPFAFALIRLDGADVPMLHAVDVESPDAMSSGMRVRVRWSEETRGSVTDIACFEPAPEHAGDATVAPAALVEAVDPVTGIITPVNLDYMYEASPEESAFFRGLAEGRLVGQRCPKCQKVYIPRAAPAPSTVCRRRTRWSCQTPAS